MRGWPGFSNLDVAALRMKPPSNVLAEPSPVLNPKAERHPTSPQERPSIGISKRGAGHSGKCSPVRSPSRATSASGGHGLRARLGERREISAAAPVGMDGVFLAAVVLCVARRRSHQAEAEMDLRTLPGLSGRAPGGETGQSVFSQRGRESRVATESGVRMPRLLFRARVL